MHAASTDRATRPTALRVAAAIGLAAVGLTVLLASGATASEGTAPYAISDMGPAPTPGFKISDISAVPTAEAATPRADPLPTTGLTLSDLGPVSSTDQTTGGLITAGDGPQGSSPAAVYPGQTTSVPN